MTYTPKHAKLASPEDAVADSRRAPSRSHKNSAGRHAAPDRVRQKPTAQQKVTSLEKA